MAKSIFENVKHIKSLSVIAQDTFKGARDLQLKSPPPKNLQGKIKKVSQKRTLTKQDAAQERVSTGNG